MIPFNKPAVTGNEKGYMRAAIENRRLSGNGEFTKKCNRWLEDKCGCNKAYLTTSCTDALEVSALLANIKPGDEVIMPSFTFVSTANAFALRGAELVFVDIHPETMNIDERRVEEAITERTKAIVAMHYAGISCEMDALQAIADEHGLFLIEDAAQGLLSTYKKRPLGTIGDFGTFSFHETKNITCGEGGALLVNNDRFIERTEILLDKGTNRSQFFRGQVDKYSWVDIGSSSQPAELNAAFLLAQMEKASLINTDRVKSWSKYYKGLLPLAEQGWIDLPHVPKHSRHNGHLFYIKAKNEKDRTALIEHLMNREIMAVFHYVPLHTSKAGKTFGRFHGEDRYTTKESGRLLRLPLYYALSDSEIDYIIEQIHLFYV
ncbi:MAG TPA: dTDP-4-amino-4,6-dideoxygalactose transaminase [Bacillales bacterium]|nr:dTDP-4-amino-4,6-dideoxygalactose transaminase [Bacillales bacterium]